MFVAMLEEESLHRRNLKSLRSGIMAGSPCPIEVMRKVIDVMGCRGITIAYGQTETSPVLTQSSLTDPIEVRVNIYPREIEEFLFTHPAVAQAAVFGVPDPKYGEELCVWVQLRPGQTATSDDIRAFCRENVAHYKVPRYVKFVTEFPTTVNGKIQKFKMREIMCAELNLKDQATA